MLNVGTSPSFDRARGRAAGPHASGSATDSEQLDPPGGHRPVLPAPGGAGCVGVTVAGYGGFLNDSALVISAVALAVGFAAREVIGPHQPHQAGARSGVHRRRQHPTDAVTHLIKIALVVKTHHFVICGKEIIDIMTEPHLDMCLDLVSNGCRRGVIQKLRHEPAGETTVADLVERLYEDDGTVNDGYQDRDVLSAQLIHNHLPKLADHGVVKYDRDSRTVQYSRTKRVESVLDALPREVAKSNT